MKFIKKSFNVPHKGSIDGLFAIFDNMAIIATGPKVTPQMCLDNTIAVAVGEASNLFPEYIKNEGKEFFYAAFDNANFINGERRLVVYSRPPLRLIYGAKKNPIWLEEAGMARMVPREFFPADRQDDLIKKFEAVLLGE